MTNNWVDLGFSTMFFVCGANPVENHPASIAHLNSARYDTNGRGRNAALVVVDPRQTRTARMISAPQIIAGATGNDMRKYDRYVRIRPGTNVAFINGVMNSIIAWMYANPAAPESVKFFAWHNSTAPNSTATRAVITDTGASSTYGPWPKYCDSRVKVDVVTGDYQRTTVTATNGDSVSNYPLLAANVDDPECVFQRMREHMAKYTPAAVAQICGCTEADIAAVRDAFIANSRFASGDFGEATQRQYDADYRASCIMYAMGATQFTTGSQGVRTYAMIQTMMGNMGRCGGGINALRGIHNVQGSTDMGVLFDLIPAYSGNPGVGQTYADYSNKLFGNRVIGVGAGNPYNRAALGLQQRGFYNMTREWFGNRDVSADADFEALWSCWPKGNGVQHIEAFRRMSDNWVPVADKPRIRACVVWGQNPAVTEPNQGPVRKGLYDLDLLVVTDMFATETAQCSRKPDGVTYLLPAASHVEEAGSVSSSGRWIQWRDRARTPKGNSKADLELLLRFAKALNAAGAFSHIKTVWSTLSGVASLYAGGAGADPYTVLFGKYGWDGVSDFEAVSGLDAEGVTLTGSEYVAEQLFKEMCSPMDAAGVAGTMWIYSGNGTVGAYNADTGNNNPAIYEDGLTSGTGINWDKANRAKVRKGAFKYRGASSQYHRYGWAWLLNRRIMYNNGELTGDVADVFVAPAFLARLWCIGGGNTLADWSTLYRTYNQLADMPDVKTSTGVHVYPNRFPAYTEPYESPYDGTNGLDLVSVWGKNMGGGAGGADPLTPLVWTGPVEATPIGTAADYPLVLTSIRCVEHFQGGPITRNNAWNVDCEPDPWVEINSADAIKYGIRDGDWVNVITARGNSVSSQNAITAGGDVAPVANWAKGFKARVGVGTLANQRVAPGTVAIPWHWGDRGLGVGSRANDLCIDSWDANTRIPEYKACLCKIERITP